MHARATKHAAHALLDETALQSSPPPTTQQMRPGTAPLRRSTRTGGAPFAVDLRLDPSELPAAGARRGDDYWDTLAYERQHNQNGDGINQYGYDVTIDNGGAYDAYGGFVPANVMDETLLYGARDAHTRHAYGDALSRQRDEQTHHAYGDALSRHGGRPFDSFVECAEGRCPFESVECAHAHAGLYGREERRARRRRRRSGDEVHRGARNGRCCSCVCFYVFDVLISKCRSLTIRYLQHNRNTITTCSASFVDSTARATVAAR
jgi:hypothetical protein